MKKLVCYLCYFISMIIIIPIVVSVLFQNDIFLFKSEHMNIERYLPYMLYETIDKEMHIETLKAQAIILRTNLLKSIENDLSKLEYTKDNYAFSSDKIKKEDRAYFDRYERACRETEGLVLTYQNKLLECSYFLCSNGRTRDAFSFFQDTRYPHMVSVPSQKDKMYENYITYHYFSMDEFVYKMNCLSGNTFANEIKILEYDDAGYVMWLRIGRKMIGGEVFRDSLGLSSSCFTIEESEEGIRIGCKGVGHGFGFSQYGANAMAQEKQNYENLLKHYFHNIAIENVNTFY